MKPVTQTMPQHITLSVPSKTFLLGEYLALTEGLAIVACTTPRFQFTLSTQQDATRKGIDDQGPGAQFLHANSQCFADFNCTFDDPHQGQGGFGASTAEFVALAKARAQLSHQPLNHPFELLSEYQQCAWNGQGLAPSGMDMIAQWLGGLQFIDKTKAQTETMNWPFEEIDFCLIRTGNKIATHTHLNDLKSVSTVNMRALVMQAHSALTRSDNKLFIEAVEDYATELRAQKFVLPSTLDLLKLLSSLPFVLTAKGCGALGADVVLVIVAHEQLSTFRDWASQQQLEVVATNYDLSGQTQIEDKAYVMVS